MQVKKLWLAILLALFAFFSNSAYSQENFNKYRHVDTFQCDSNPYAFQVIFLNESCGTLLSPCYPKKYPSNLANGFRIWSINSNKENLAPVAGYRLTLNSFEVERNGYLTFAPNLTYHMSSFLNTIDGTYLKMEGHASMHPGVVVNFQGNVKNRQAGGHIDVNETKLFANFYVPAVAINSTGFNVTYCADFDRCHKNHSSPLPCDPARYKCVRNGFKNYSCECQDGLVGVNCSDDINECEDGTHNCADNTTANCTNTYGNFSCSCHHGFTGNGKVCTNINECENNTCHSNATCHDLIGGYNCSCIAGFTGNGSYCKDIDECLDNLTNCTEVYGLNCTNTIGSYKCSCRSGFDGYNGSSCNNINECDILNSCASNATCNDTLGSFTCVCNNGFTGDGYNSCTDINECDDSNICNNTLKENCQNLNGSYNCSCKAPFYRGIPSNCAGYYCPGTIHNRRSIAGSFTNDASCTTSGFIEWPQYHDRYKTYQTSQIISWLVNFTQLPENISGINFTFIDLSIERMEDFIIFSNSSSILSEPRLAAFSGNLTFIYNNENPANNSNPINYDKIRKSFFVAGKSAYVYFYSDRSISSTGFQMIYEPLKYVNNCAINPCVNGGRCTNKLFTYICTDCAIGYTGQNCSEDLIIYSNFKVFTFNKLTNSFLRVNFVVSELNINSIFFSAVETIVRIVENNNRTTIFTNTTPVTNQRQLISIVEPVIPFTNYTINVTARVRKNGQYHILSSTDPMLTITSSPILPGTPEMLKVDRKAEDVFNVTWFPPAELNVGKTIAYELEYKLNQSYCPLYQSFNTTMNCNAETKLVIPPNNKIYILTGLLFNRYYQIRIRAYTRVGSGNWTGYTGFFTGNSVCPPQTTQVLANSNPCTSSSKVLMSGNFPNPYLGFETLFWIIAIPKNTAIQFHVDYLNLEKNQDHVDIGQGKFPNQPISKLNSSVVYILTGNIQDSIQHFTFTNNTINNGYIFVRFHADVFNTNRLKGFLLHYETNSSKCHPTSPCQNGGSCQSKNFDFKCNCTDLWTGKTCISPLVKLNVSCASSSSSSIFVFWNVTPEWKNDISAISATITSLLVEVFLPLADLVEKRASPKYQIVNVYMMGSHQVINKTTVSFHIKYENSSKSLPTNSSNHRIVGLSPYQKINVTVEAKPGNPLIPVVQATAICQTKEAIPKQPMIVNASSPSGNQISIYWSPTYPLNGRATGYRLTYEQQDSLQYNETRSTGNVTLNNSFKVISGLRSYRRYFLTVAVINDVGEGPSINTSLTTSSTTPAGPVSNVTIDRKARNATLTISRPVVVTGLFTFDIIYSKKNKSFPAITNVPSVYTLSHLDPFSSYSVEVYPRSAGKRGNYSYKLNFTTLEDTPGPAHHLSVNSVTSSGLFLKWSPPIVRNGIIIGYRVEWTKVGKVNSSYLSLSNVTSYKINGLDPYTQYTFNVYAKTSAGEGKVSASIQARTSSSVPSIKPGASVLPYNGSTNNLKAADTSTTHVIENPCNRKGEIFSEKNGAVSSINVVVKENSAAATSNLSVWSAARSKTPIPPYITGTLQCLTTRKKRELTTDSTGYIIGSNATCDTRSTTVCNGPLVPGRTYQVAYQAKNAGGSSQITPYGGDFYLQKKTTSALSTGELAAIIIACLVLLVLLALLSVAYNKKKRIRRLSVRRKKAPNKKGIENKVVEEIPAALEKYRSTTSINILKKKF